MSLKLAVGAPGPTLWTWPTPRGGYYRELAFALPPEGPLEPWAARLAETLATLDWQEFDLDVGPLRARLGQDWPGYLARLGLALFAAFGRAVRIRLAPDQQDAALGAALSRWLEETPGLIVVDENQPESADRARLPGLAGTVARMLSLTHKPA